MVFGWWKRRQRARFLGEHIPPDWVEHVHAQPFTTDLKAEELQRLVAYARAFANETHFEGCGGLEVEEHMVRSVALQACRLILNLDQDHYRCVRSVLIYPAAFVYSPQGSDERTMVAGLAVPDGPVLLSWAHVSQGAKNGRDGRNVVYHEFAHKLDMLDGDTDGAPALCTDTQFHTWREVVGVEFQRLQRAAGRNRKTLINHYGAKNTGEFFAEATEVFFERPRELRKHHRQLYRVLKRFYGQNPASIRS